MRRRRLNDAARRLFPLAQSAPLPCQGVMAAAGLLRALQAASRPDQLFVLETGERVLPAAVNVGGETQEDPVMTKTLALLASAIGAVAVLLTANPAGARGWYRYRVYPPPPIGSPGWRESPTYAPDAPPPRSFYNNGFPDRQLDAR